MSRPPLRVAVLGAGTVGREVVRALVERSAALAAADAPPLVLAGVAVRDVDAAIGRGLPADVVTDAPAHLVASPETDVIVELIGGDEPARTLIAAALGAGKPVVTANKHVLAHHGPELEAIARRSAAPLRFEAAVGGGIPVLGPLAADLASNRVTSVRGIVNGTTNHILTAMAREGRTYESVLAEAQSLGYAEADPSGDVEGDDAVNKVVVLARLAFGAWLDPACVVSRPPALRGRVGDALGAPGITGVGAGEIAGAAALGLAVRLLARASRQVADGPIETSVLPTAVPSDSPLGRTDGVRNRVEVAASPLGTVGFDGPGAGGPATASAVLGDLLAIARGAGSTWAGAAPAGRVGPDVVRTGLDVDRHWFAFLSGIPAGPVVDGPARHLVERTAELPNGLAILTVPITLRALRDRLLEVVPPTLDAPLYPVET